MTNHDGISSELMVKLLGVTLYIGHPGGQTHKHCPKLTPNMGIMQITWYYANDIQDKAWRYFFIIFPAEHPKNVTSLHIKTKRSLASKFGAIYPKYQ